MSEDNTDQPILCGECDNHALYRMFQFGPQIRYADRCIAHRPPIHSHDRQLVEDATVEDLQANTGLCQECKTVYGTTWRTSPEECGNCDKGLQRLSEVSLKSE